MPLVDINTLHTMAKDFVTEHGHEAVSIYKTCLQLAAVARRTEEQRTARIALRGPINSAGGRPQTVYIIKSMRVIGSMLPHSPQSFETKFNLQRPGATVVLHEHLAHSTHRGVAATIAHIAAWVEGVYAYPAHWPAPPQTIRNSVTGEHTPTLSLFPPYAISADKIADKADTMRSRVSANGSHTWRIVFEHPVVTYAKEWSTDSWDMGVLQGILEVSVARAVTD